MSKDCSVLGHMNKTVRESTGHPNDTAEQHTPAKVFMHSNPPVEGSKAIGSSLYAAQLMHILERLTSDDEVGQWL